MNISKILTSLLLVCFTLELQSKELKVMTFNIRHDVAGDKGTKDWSNRLPIITPEIKKASIIGVQEALQHQLADILTELPNYASVGVGRDDGKNKGEFTPILYRKDLWKADVSGTFWLSNTPSKAGSKHWGNSSPRICTWVRLIDSNGAGIYVFNTHLDAKSENSRKKAAKLIIKRIEARKYIDEPVLLLGDFNSLTTSAEIKSITEATGLRGKILVDSYLSTNPIDPNPSTFNKWKTGDNPGRKIDHIFHSPELKTISAEILHPKKGNAVASDHNPQFSTIYWNAEEQNQKIEWRFVKETLLNKEFGGGKGLILRWDTKKINIRFIGGNADQLKEAKSATAEINAALADSGTSLEVSTEPNDSEIRCYIGTFEELKEVCKKEKLSPPNNYAGFASLRWITETKVVIESIVLIATDRSPKDLLHHVFLEEITQTLGLPGDNTVYPESITYSRGHDQGSAPQLSVYDKKAIHFIYKHLTPADDVATVTRIFLQKWGSVSTEK